MIIVLKCPAHGEEFDFEVGVVSVDDGIAPDFGTVECPEGCKLSPDQERALDAEAERKAVKALEEGAHIPEPIIPGW